MFVVVFLASLNCLDSGFVVLYFHPVHLERCEINNDTEMLMAAVCVYC